MNRSMFTVALEPAKTREGIALLERLDQELVKRYPSQIIHGFDPEEIDRHGRFVVARSGSRAIGCGTLRTIRDTVGEIKRLFVEPSFRGQGVARSIIHMLETEARHRGITLLKAETGSKQPEAVRLFESSGFISIPPFGEYVDNPHSLCFEKRIANL
jgi:putative acetyltransferase